MCHACLIEFKIIHIIMGFTVTQTHQILIISSKCEARLVSATGIWQTYGWRCWPETWRPPSSSTWLQGWRRPYQDLLKPWLLCPTPQTKLRPWAGPPWDLPASWTGLWLCTLRHVHLSSRLSLTQDYHVTPDFPLPNTASVTSGAHTELLQMALPVPLTAQLLVTQISGAEDKK